MGAFRPRAIVECRSQVLAGLTWHEIHYGTSIMTDRGAARRGARDSTGGLGEE
jgi:hypothetical protein